jgi:hypothetical protein
VDLKTIERIAMLKHGEPFTKIATTKLINEFPEVIETYEWATRYHKPIAVGYVLLLFGLNCEDTRKAKRSEW